METEVLCQKGTFPSRRQVAVGLKFLLGKWMYEGVTEEETIQIWILSNWIFEHCGKEAFLGFTQLGLALLLKDLGRFLKPGEPRSGMKWIPIDGINLQFFPDPHTYWGWKLGSTWLSRCLGQVRYLKIKKRRYPPPKFMGVGYKDKGSRRLLAEDGTLDWKLVASLLEAPKLEVVYADFSDPQDPRILENAGYLGDGWTVT